MGKIIQELYNGKVKIEFNSDRHKYNRVEFPKEWLISVTACTGMVDKSRILMLWAEKLTKEHLLNHIGKPLTEELILEATSLHRTKKEEAASIGVLAHQYCQAHICSILDKTEKPKLPKDEQVLNSVTGFLRWINESKIKFLASENIVYSRKKNYVGIFDALAKIDGKLCLIDFKTSKSGHYPEYKFQLAGYRYAYEEEHGLIDHNIIAHFNKETGDFELIPCEDYKKDVKTFLACLQIKQRIKELK